MNVYVLVLFFECVYNYTCYFNSCLLLSKTKMYILMFFFFIYIDKLYLNSEYTMNCYSYLMKKGQRLWTS